MPLSTIFIIAGALIFVGGIVVYVLRRTLPIPAVLIGLGIAVVFVGLFFMINVETSAAAFAGVRALTGV